MQCLSCGNYWSHLPAPDSEPGEIVQCKKCKHLQIFTNDLRLRELNDLEKAEMVRDPRVLWNKGDGRLLFLGLICIFIVVALIKIGAL